MEITSVNNELVKNAAKLQQKKYRTQTGLFLLEGFKAIKEAYDFGIEIDEVFVEKNHLTEYKFLSEKIIETTDNVLKKICSTESAPSAIAVAKQINHKPEIIKNAKKVVLLENIKDLGNLGTIIRSSVAFGADMIILYGCETVDIYNPKCVRASVGNLWKLPVISVKDLKSLQGLCKNFTRIATLPKSDNLLKTYKPNFPCLVMFGSEADGLSQELIDYSTDSLKIEMKDNVESLNLATSVSVILYELFVD